MAKYCAKITVHCRGFWLPYEKYCGDQLPCNNYRALPWWLATVQSIQWLPITVHRLLCNTVVAAYRGKRYRDEKSLPKKALVILMIMTSLMHTVDGCLYVECVCMCVHVFKVVVSTVMYVIQFPPPLSLSRAAKRQSPRPILTKSLQKSCFIGRI